MAPEPRLHIVEEGVRLSESLIWSLQQQYYVTRGIRAWSGGAIPSWITTNPLLAAAFANVAVAWALDGLQGRGVPVRRGAPIYIVELAGGTGMFAYRFLEQLSALEDVWGRAGLDFRYVLTDIVPENVDFWWSHPRLRPYIESGRLDVALYAPLESAVIPLRSGAHLAPGSLPNPLVAIANYFVDSIPIDLYRVSNGRVEEGRLTLSVPQALHGRPRPKHLPQLHFHVDWRPTNGPHDDPIASDILDFYATKVAEATVSFPLGAVRALRHLDELSSGRLLFLVADKGVNSLEGLGGAEHETPILHDHCFSYDANLDALGRYADALGGCVFHNDPGAYLCLAAMVLGARRTELPGTGLVWRSHTDARDPSEFYPHLRTFIEADRPVDPRTFVTMLRESHWDPYIVTVLKRKVESFSGLEPSMRRRLLQGLRRAWANYFFVGEAHDLPFVFGGLFFDLEAFEDARECYQASLADYGPSHVTLHNIALTWLRRGAYREALPWFERALELQPDYAPSLKWRSVACSEVDVGVV